MANVVYRNCRDSSTWSPIKMSPRKAPPKPPERDYWLLSEAIGTWYSHADLCYVYRFSDGKKHRITRETVGCTWEGDVRVPKAATDPAAIKVDKLGTVTVTATNLSWSPGTVGIASTDLGPGTISIPHWSKRTQTPRQWLDHRVSEIAEQGRL